MFTERDQKLVGEYWTHRKGHNRGKVGPRRWIVCYEHKMVFIGMARFNAHQESAHGGANLF